MAEGKERCAVVALTFYDVTDADTDDMTVSSTAEFWGIEDIEAARTLRDQLIGLLGEPGREIIGPDVLWASMRDKETWPGLVYLDGGTP